MAVNASAALATPLRQRGMILVHQLTNKSGVFFNDNYDIIFIGPLNYTGLSVWIITPSILKENTQPIHIQHPTETLKLSDHIL